MLTAQELSMIEAALCYWQNDLREDSEFSSDMSVDEIDALIAKLNKPQDRTVIISVSGGVADCVESPAGINVYIHAEDEGGVYQIQSYTD